MQKIIVILGQTATGKSDLAVKLAKKLNGEIISADSRQVYKGLDIGTGKITPDTKNFSNFGTGQAKKEDLFIYKGVRHYMINIANPKHKFTVAEYQKKAIYAIAEIAKKGKIPIICGGTGFYIDAVTKGTVFPEVLPDKKQRKELEKKSAIELFKILQKLDKRRAQEIKEKNEINNKVRLIRAIEIAKYLGKVPKLRSDTNSAYAENVSLGKYKFIKIGLYLLYPKLKKKIEKRVQKMFDDGLLKEIKKIKRSGISSKRLKEFGFEYYNPIYEKVVSDTLKYAKRQMTWFKRDKEVVWHDASKKSLLSCILKDFVLF